MDILEWCSLILNDGKNSTNSSNWNYYESLNYDLMKNIKYYLFVRLIEETKITSIGNGISNYRINMISNFDGYVFEHHVYIIKAKLTDHFNDFVKTYSDRKLAIDKDNTDMTYCAIKFIGIMFTSFIITNYFWNSPFLSNEWLEFNNQYHLRKKRFLEVCSNEKEE